jgi:peptidoglycan hydrolase-like protein with peptidoglycan-binding domain
MRKFSVPTTAAALGLILGLGLPAAAQEAGQTMHNPQQTQQNTSPGGKQPATGSTQQQQKRSAAEPAKPSTQDQTASVSLDRSKIEQVQRALDRKGFKSGRTDGIVGSETESALRSFQQRQDLDVNGNIDRQTLAALNLEDLTQPATVGTSGMAPKQPASGSQNSHNN